jgi:hypothetical protein
MKTNQQITTSIPKSELLTAPPVNGQLNRPRPYLHHSKQPSSSWFGR